MHAHTRLMVEGAPSIAPEAAAHGDGIGIAAVTSPSPGVYAWVHGHRLPRVRRGLTVGAEVPGVVLVQGTFFDNRHGLASALMIQGTDTVDAALHSRWGAGAINDKQHSWGAECCSSLCHYGWWHHVGAYNPLVGRARGPLRLREGLAIGEGEKYTYKQKTVQ